MFSLQWKFVLASGAIFALTFCVSSEAHSQGFRVGNFIQAGGGQGFRMGGPRFGMHFGGGQGATIGGSSVGMRFGNGQGARFGGMNYGMQFGGGQGTQIGQLYTTPNVTPGTYYYGDVSGAVYPQPTYVPPPVNFETGAPNVVPAAAPEYEAQINATIPPANNTDEFIRLSLPAETNARMNYRLNGTEFILEPGRYVLMAKGQPWRVEFSAGDGSGNRQADLSAGGNFEFTKTPAGSWMLVNTDNMADAQTQVAKPSVNPPAEDNSVFDDFVESEQKSVLIGDDVPTDNLSAEPAEATTEPADNLEIEPATDPNEVQVVPAEKPSDDGDK